MGELNRFFLALFHVPKTWFIYTRPMVGSCFERNKKMAMKQFKINNKEIKTISKT